MAMRKLQHAGHTFELVELSQHTRESWSLRCVDLLDGEDASDVSWPSDAEVSREAGLRLKFSDGGDDLTEAIYHPA